MIDKVSDHMPNYLLVNDIIETKKYQKINLRELEEIRPC